MEEHSNGYRQARGDAERVCAMIENAWRSKAEEASGTHASIAILVADAVALAAKSIREMEPGFVAPNPATKKPDRQ